jgi:hypothetical protein
MSWYAGRITTFFLEKRLMSADETRQAVMDDAISDSQ